MKILGWPRGPPPPSQETERSLIQRTGCLWMRSMAANGRGCCKTLHQLVLLTQSKPLPLSRSYLNRITQLTSPSPLFQFTQKAKTHTCSSIIVCSNLGPTIALLLSCWLRLQTVALLGACITLFFSPSSTLSCRVRSKLPSELVGVALVALTGEGSFLPW